MLYNAGISDPTTWQLCQSVLSVVDPVVELHGLLAEDEAVAQAGPLLLPGGHAALDHGAVVVLPGGRGRRRRRRLLSRLQVEGTRVIGYYDYLGTSHKDILVIRQYGHFLGKLAMRQII